MNTARYLGHWILIPELSLYQSGEPPLSGEYLIGSDGELIEFEVIWKDAAGLDHNLRFGGPLDGKKHPTETPGVSHICYEQISDSILDSTAYDEDEVGFYARRAVSEDGGLLVVSQVLHGEHGKSSNFQVYRRKNA